MLVNQLKKSFITLFVIIIGMFTWTAVSAAQSDPYQLTEQVTSKLFPRIEKEFGQIKQSPERMRTIVREELMPYIHVNYAGSLVLGQHFRSTSPEQRDRFFSAFGQLIEQNFAQVLTLYKDQQIKIIKKPLNSNDNLVTVRVHVVQPSVPVVNLDFQWRKNTRTGEWQAFDMAANGISLLNAKRAEWNNVIRQQGIDTLTEQVSKEAKAPIVINQ